MRVVGAGPSEESCKKEETMTVSSIRVHSVKLFESEDIKPTLRVHSMHPRGGITRKVRKFVLRRIESGRAEDMGSRSVPSPLNQRPLVKNFNSNHK
jgi:hypothetical protein